MKYIISLILIGFFSFSLFAQDEDQLLVTELKQSTIVTEPPTLHKGFFRTGIAYSYSVGDKLFNDKGKKEFIPENTWVKDVGFTFLAQYGITNRLEFFAQIPYSSRAMYWSSLQSIPLLKEKNDLLFDIKGKGFGEIITGLSYQIIEGSKTKGSLTAGLFVDIPIGEKNPTNIEDDWTFDLPMSSGEASLEAELKYKKINYPYAFHVYGKFKYSFGGTKIMSPVEEQATGFKTGNRYTVGVVHSLMLNEWLAIKNDLSFGLNQKDSFDDEYYDDDVDSWVLYYLPYIAFQLKRFRFAEGIGIPIKGKSYPADPMYVILVQYIF